MLPNGINPSRTADGGVDHDLVDAYRLMIDPVILGGGTRVFSDDGTLRPLRLAHSGIPTTGAVRATYARPDG